MKKIYENSETGCCPRFNPEPWTDTTVVWKDKLFLQDRIMTFFHIPLNFGQIVVKNTEKIKNAEALPSVPLMLYDDNSLFGSDVYIAVKKNVPDAKMTKISGTFLSKVFEGSFEKTGEWIKKMNEYVKSKGKKLKKIFFFYTTCPACAKYYGKNYVVVLAKI
jgi:effector-binding domain-containing protein